MDELVGMIVGNYFLIECLSRESTVETYRARPTTRGGCDVIMRLFRPRFPDTSSFTRHFADEVEKLWRVQHEHIIPLLEFGNGEELLFTITHFPLCETLEQRLARPERITLEETMRIVTELCSALHAIHEKGILHGNLQPSSIFLDPDEGVRLTNFSVRRAYQEGDPLTFDVAEGNPAYTAPEQGLGIVSSASDLYALGVLLFRLLAGVVPYAGTPEEVAFKHADKAIPSVRAVSPELPEALEQVVACALAKAREARFPTAAALASALQAAVVPDRVLSLLPAPQRRIEVRAKRVRSALYHVV